MFSKHEIMLIFGDFKGESNNISIDLVDSELSTFFSLEHSDVIFSENCLIVNRYNRGNYYVIPYDKIVRINFY